MAATNGTAKEKFNRVYLTYNPNRYQGPDTQVVDTVVRPIPEKENG